MTCQLWLLHCGLRIHSITAYPQTYSLEARQLYISGHNILLWLRRELERVQQSDLTSTNYIRAHAELLRAICFTATLLIIINAVLHLENATSATLVGSLLSLVDCIIVCAKEAALYRPLGSLHAIWSLLIAWAAVPRQAKKTEIALTLQRINEAGIKARTASMMVQADSMFKRLAGNKTLLE